MNLSTESPVHTGNEEKWARRDLAVNPEIPVQLRFIKDFKALRAYPVNEV